jgi:hypothetical protein
MRLWTGFIGLRAEKSGRLLRIWFWTSGFHKILRISLSADILLSSQIGLYSREIIIP